MIKIWKKVKKLAGKYSAGRPACININGTREIYSGNGADAMGSKIKYISILANYDTFLNIKTKKSK